MAMLGVQVERNEANGIGETTVRKGVNLFRPMEGEISPEGCVRNTCGVLINLGGRLIQLPREDIQLKVE